MEDKFSKSINNTLDQLAKSLEKYSDNEENKELLDKVNILINKRNTK